MNRPLPLPRGLEHLIEKRGVASRRKKERRSTAGPAADGRATGDNRRNGDRRRAKRRKGER